MPDDNPTGAPPTPVSANKSHQPAVDNRGHQPQSIAVAFPKIQGGHQPTTGQAAPANPPNQGSSGKK
jgi:hypothetical protein